MLQRPAASSPATCNPSELLVEPPLDVDKADRHLCDLWLLGQGITELVVKATGHLPGPDQETLSARDGRVSICQRGAGNVR